MKLIRYISFPFMPLYYLVTWMRNKLYDLNIKKSKSYHLPVICVGNLSVGGTGKTPMIEYLISMLKDTYQLATLSRGYKRKTKGFQMADKNSSAETVGDEPFQFYHKFNEAIVVAVDSNRQRGIETLVKHNSLLNLILLDDAFQHRKVNAGMNILLTTFNNLYVDDYVLPSGNLREPRCGSDRAHIIVVTKCPNDIDDSKKDSVKRRLKLKTNQRLFFSYIEYSKTIISENDVKYLKDVTKCTLVTGIANAKPLVIFLDKQSIKYNHVEFKDHHDFTEKDLELMQDVDLIITTEKDFVRLKKFEVLRKKLYYLPIKTRIDRSDDFDKIIIDFVKNY